MTPRQTRDVDPVGQCLVTCNKKSNSSRIILFQSMIDAYIFFFRFVMSREQYSI